MTTIYLIRHAEAEFNRFHRVQGVCDSPVTQLGLAQISCLERRFADLRIDAVYSSDLGRTMRTAQAVSRPKGLPLHTTPALREVDFGVWENRAFGELMTNCQEHMARFLTGAPDWRVEGGESLGHCVSRMYAAMLDLAGAHPNGTVAAVSHGSAINLLAGHLLGMQGSLPDKLKNTAVSCVEVQDGAVSLAWYNDASHLTPDLLERMNPQKDVLVSPGELLWFRPWDPETEQDYYAACREEGWLSSHGTMDRYDGAAKRAAALHHSARDRGAVQVVMCGHDRAGMLELDPDTGAEEGVGAIAFYYVDETHRRKGSGIQLLGEANAYFVRLGRTCLRLRCAPENHQAYRFYTRHGFREIGMAEGGPVPLLLLERPVSVGYVGTGEDTIS